MKQALLFLLLPFCLYGKVNENKDFQIWNRNTSTKTLSQKHVLTLEMEYRYRNGIKKLYYKHYQGEWLYSLAPSLTMGMGYRQTYHIKKGEWIPGYNPIADLIFHFTHKGWAFSNRNRVLYRIEHQKKGKKKSWIYRNKTLLLLPPLWKEMQGSVYIADEIFWRRKEGHGRGIDQNRFFSGYLFPLSKYIQGDLFYLYRSKKREEKRWIHQNILGFSLSFFF